MPHDFKALIDGDREVYSWVRDLFTPKPAAKPEQPTFTIGGHSYPVVISEALEPDVMLVIREELGRALTQSVDRLLEAAMFPPGGEGAGERVVTYGEVEAAARIIEAAALDKLLEDLRQNQSAPYYSAIIAIGR